MSDASKPETMRSPAMYLGMFTDILKAYRRQHNVLVDVRITWPWVSNLRTVNEVQLAESRLVSLE